MAAPAEAQARLHGSAGLHGIPVYTRADPVPGGGSLGEVRLVQPVLMLHAAGWEGRVGLTAGFNLEGLTIPDGELAPGDWGEGLVDRRHPHTYVHELVLSTSQRLGGANGRTRVSLSAGKGFAPFGTDDPMSRPPLRYPVNHHLAQVLERAIVVGAVERGPLTAELGLFNGDEPERPGQWPRIGGRFGDSWSGRLLVAPTAGAEVQGSFARVHSPEHRPGAGTDQHKWSLSARWEAPVRGQPVYGLVEWARTSEAEGFFVFHSLLAEGAWSPGGHRLCYRFERTERPEEERTSDRFRSRRPHLENSILGVSRWTVQTAGYGYEASVPAARLRLQPFVELSYGRIGKVGGGLFEAEAFYGRNSFWSLSLGARIGLGRTMHRMGRYGVVAESRQGHGYMNAGAGMEESP